MRVSVDLCAVLRDHGGGCEGEVELAAGATVADAVRGLGLPGGPRVIVCVNGKPVPEDTSLAEGDRVYVFLPVSGG